MVAIRQRDVQPHGTGVVRSDAAMRVAGLFVVTVAGTSANGLITPIIPEVLAGVGASESAAGLLIAAPAVLAVPLAPLLGLLADRFDRRAMLVASSVLLAVAGVASAFAASVGPLIALRAVQGVASVGLMNLVVVVIADWWAGPQRARWIGINSVVQTSSLMLLPVAGGLLTDALGWRGPFWAYGLIGGAAALVSLRIPTRRRPQSASVGEQARAFLPILRSPRTTALLTTSAMTFVLISATLWTVLPLYVADEFGMGPQARGLLLGAPAIGSIVVASRLGRLQQRLGRRPLLVLGATLMAVSLAVTALTSSVVLLVVAVVGIGMANGATIPSLQHVSTEAAPPTSRGAMVTTMVSAARIGQLVGPIAGAAALNAAGAEPTLIGAAVLSMTVMPPLFTATLRDRLQAWPEDGPHDGPSDAAGESSVNGRSARRGDRSSATEVTR